MGHVFLSYSRADHAFVQQLADFLDEAGIHVWYDYEIEIGESFAIRIQQAITDCSAFVAVLSPDATASKWVVREISFADDLNKPMLPLLLRDCLKPIQLSQLQHEDVRGGAMPPARFVQRLRSIPGVTLRSRAGHDSGPAVPPPPTPVPSAPAPRVRTPQTRATAPIPIPPTSTPPTFITLPTSITSAPPVTESKQTRPRPPAGREAGLGKAAFWRRAALDPVEIALPNKVGVTLRAYRRKPSRLGQQ